MNENNIKSRIKDKIEDVEGYLQEISEFLPSSLEDYILNKMAKAACERGFEKIVEACVDIAFLTIRIKKFPFPENDEGTFTILHKKGILQEALSKRLISAKGMRNFIIHEYEEIDDSKVFRAISEELPEDVREFIKSIREEIK